jgi:hypothetical protein
VLWALARPAAMAGLVAAFVIGVGLRSVAQWFVARRLGLAPAPGGRPRLDLLGSVAAFLSGTGWGRPTDAAAGRRDRWAVLAGPVAVLAASQFAFAAYHSAYPGLSLPLRLYRPSDVLRGVVAPTSAAELILSVAVGLLCFGLVALLPVPPFDGYRLFARSVRRRALERLALVAVFILTIVPVDGRPPVLLALDTVATPLVRMWA